MNIHTMFGFNLPSGFRGEDQNLKAYRQWMPIESNKSYDLYILDHSCYTPSWLFLRGIVPLSREPRSYFYTPGFPRGGCSLNLNTQLCVCKYQQLKHLYCSIQHLTLRSKSHEGHCGMWHTALWSSTHIPNIIDLSRKRKMLWPGQENTI